MRKFRCFTRLPSLLRKRDGVTAIEFAVISPVLILLTIGIIELSIVFFIQGVIELAASNTARLGATGYNYDSSAGATQTNQTQAIQQELNLYTAGILDMTKLQVTTAVYNTISDVANGNAPISGGPPYGGSGQIVVYTITYPWTFSTPLIGAFFGTNNTYTISSRMVVQNEPFN